MVAREGWELMREQLTRAGAPFTDLQTTWRRLHGNRPETEALRRVGRGSVRADSGRVPRSVLVDQAAALLGLSRRTVYYRIRAGKLTTLRTRCGSQRVLMASIEGLLREMGQKAVGGAVPAAVEDLPGRDDLTIGQDAGI
jgi:excisionase family DNA binding protein